MSRKLGLVGGIVSSLLYVAMTFGIAMLDPGYDSVSQTVSELSAVGAPTRTVWVAFGVFYTLLVSAFGWSVLHSAGSSKGLAAAGRAILAYGLLGVPWIFAPMHLRETLAAGGGTASDTMHLVLAGVTVALMVVAILSAAVVLGGWFRVYSVVTLVVLLFFGLLTGTAAPRVSANLPTPWLGVWERVNIGAFLAWIVALALVLLEVEWPRKRALLPAGSSSGGLRAAAIRPGQFDAST